ncbi:hypothetical protein AB4Y43_16940 [Paraburkholderia sp. BR10872]|uniref:hypothetical protein n=1 Tax=Paraburkholderia sp. BR10872 TaxID=3236989 RepID=UPI0034D26980
MARIPEALRDALEREFGAQPNGQGEYVLKVATCSTRDFTYELLPVDGRDAALEQIAASYRLADGPQHRALVVKSLDEARTVGVYYTRIDRHGRVSNDEAFAIERFEGLDDPGAFEVVAPALSEAIAAQEAAPVSRPARPKF